jgi:hypothetical protein
MNTPSEHEKRLEMELLEALANDQLEHWSAAPGVQQQCEAIIAPYLAERYESQFSEDLLPWNRWRLTSLLSRLGTQFAGVVLSREILETLAQTTLQVARQPLTTVQRLRNTIQPFLEAEFLGLDDLIGRAQQLQPARSSENAKPMEEASYREQVTACLSAANAMLQQLMIRVERFAPAQTLEFPEGRTTIHWAETLMITTEPAVVLELIPVGEDCISSETGQLSIDAQPKIYELLLYFPEPIFMIIELDVSS